MNTTPTASLHKPRAIDLIAKPRGFDDAMRYALAHAQEQSMVIDMLMDKIADLHAQLVVARKVARMPRPPRDVNPGAHDERVVRRACEVLKIEYAEITERGPGGNLLRNKDVMAKRDRLIMFLLGPGATPAGPMPIIAIARGLGFGTQHSSIIAAEQRILRTLGLERPSKKRKPKELAIAA